MFSSFLFAARDKPEFAHVIELLRPKTSRSRFRAFCRHLRLFRRFCKAYGLCPMPATTSTILRYIAALRRRYARSSIIAMLHPIAKMHRECGFRSPRSERLVSLTLQAMKKSVAKERCATPMPPATYRRLMTMLPATTPVELRTRAVCASAYWGMASATELASLTLDEAKREANAWTFFEVGYRRRMVVLERAENAAYCPIDALEKYMKAFNVRRGALWRSCAFNGRPRTTPTGAATLRHDFETSAALQSPEFSEYSFDSLKNGCLEAGFHAGVAFAVLVGRGGFCNQAQLERRLRRIAILRPEDRRLPHGGQRARSRRRPGRSRYFVAR